jgi:hypothetical protein
VQVTPKQLLHHGRYLRVGGFVDGGSHLRQRYSRQDSDIEKICDGDKASNSGSEPKGGGKASHSGSESKAGGKAIHSGWELKAGQRKSQK